MARTTMTTARLLVAPMLVAALLWVPGCGDDGGSDASADSGAGDAPHDTGSPDLDATGPDAVTPDGEAPDGAGDDGGGDDGGPPGLVLGLTDRSFTIDGTETFLLAVSYYGGIGAPPETVTADLDRLEGLGFNNLRVWATWPRPSDVSAVVRNDGSLDPDALGRLEFLIETARSHGMTVDVTFSRGNEGISDGSFDAYRTAEASLATELLPYRNVFFDLGNERDVMDTRYVSVDEVRDLAMAVRAADPDRIVTASLGGNPPDSAAAKYIELYMTADIDLAAPHFPRNDVWADQTAERIDAMRTILVDAGWDRPIYLQEEARRGYSGAMWPKSDFLTAVAEARSAGAAGWCFHTDAGFDLTAGTFFDQLDDVELDTIDELEAAAAP